VKINHFTSGNVSYGALQDHLESTWITLRTMGIAGALDRLGYSAYGDTLGNLTQAIDDLEW
jgi:hypothetical protein